MRTVQIADQTWYVANDLLVELNCNPKVTKLIQAITTNLGSNHVCTVPLCDSIGRTQATTLISEMALVYALQRSRKPQAKQIAAEIGLSLTLVVSPIETETIRVIEAAFKHLNPIRQFFVCGYRIDLYFPQQRVAVECDETHHNQSRVADKERQLAITASLDCRFVRYQPQAPGFNVGAVINELIMLLRP